MMKKRVDMEVIRNNTGRLCESVIQKKMESSSETYRLLNEFPLKVEVKSSYVESSGSSSNLYENRVEAAQTGTLKKNFQMLSGDTVLGKTQMLSAKDDRSLVWLERGESRNQFERRFEIDQHAYNERMKKGIEDHSPVKNDIKNPSDLVADMNAKMLFRRKNKLLLEMILKGQEQKKTTECLEMGLCVPQNVMKNELDVKKNSVNYNVDVPPSGCILSEYNVKELLNEDYKLSKELPVGGNSRIVSLDGRKVISNVCNNSVGKGQNICSNVSEDEKSVMKKLYESAIESVIKERLLEDVDMKKDKKNESAIESVIKEKLLVDVEMKNDKTNEAAIESVIKERLDVGMKENKRNEAAIESVIKERLLVDVEMKEEKRNESSVTHKMNCLESCKKLNHEVENVALHENNNSIGKALSENKIFSSEDLLNARLLMQLRLKDEEEKKENVEMKSFVNNKFEKQIESITTQETNVDNLSDETSFGRRVVSSEELLNATLLLQLKMNEEERGEFVERLEMNSFKSNEIFENKFQDNATIETNLENLPGKVLEKLMDVSEDIFNTNPEIQLETQEKEERQAIAEDFKMESVIFNQVEGKFEDVKTINNLATMLEKPVLIKLTTNAEQEVSHVPVVINEQLVHHSTVNMKQQIDLKTAESAVAEKQPHGNGSSTCSGIITESGFCAKKGSGCSAGVGNEAGASSTAGSGSSANSSVTSGLGSSLKNGNGAGANSVAGVIHSTVSANVVQNDIIGIECNVCCERLKSQNDLKKHICTRFSCNECHQVFTKAEDLTRHWFRHTNIKNLSCSICKKPFVNEPKLSCHMLSHSNINEHMCQICFKVLLREDDLSKHLLTHKTASKCSVCGQIFKAKSDLYKHLESHQSKNIKREIFVKPPNLKSDLSNQYSNENTKSVQMVKVNPHKLGNVSLNNVTKPLAPKYEAPQQETSKKRKGKNMIKLCVENVSHNNISGIFVPKDNVSFQLSANSYTNITGIVVKPNVPQNNASKVFVQNKNPNLKSSVVVESNIDSYQVKIDNSSIVKDNTPHQPLDNTTASAKTNNAVESNHNTFYLSEFLITKDNFNESPFRKDNTVKCIDDMSVKVKNRDGYICNICNKSLSSPKGLQMHILGHKEIKDHCCSTCNKSFVEKRNLLRHEKIHQDVKDFICNTCGKSFTENYKYLRHMYKHTGEKPYPCNLCLESFFKKDDLRKHHASHTAKKS